MTKGDSLPLFCIVLLLFLTTTVAQSKSETDLYNWFDTSLGKENLAVNNGSIHFNYDAAISNKHRYLDTNTFVMGSINYEGQKYHEMALKYDICDDVLVLKPAIESEYVAVNLIQEKVNSFVIHGKKFAKLVDASGTVFKNGYYEEKSIGTVFTLYINHFKSKSKVVAGEFTQVDYNLNNTFLLKNKNTWTMIDTKRSIQKLFPKLKRKIDDFYSANQALEKNAKPTFLENLMVYIHNLEKY